MPTLVGIRFKPLDRLQYFDAGDLDLSVGERVIVETDEGQHEGTVVIAADQVLYSDLRGPLDCVLRKAQD
jgi:cell fate regulator YaaT (PSP1 superfamily)